MAHLAHPLARGLGGDGLVADDIAREAQRDLWGEEILFDFFCDTPGRGLGDVPEPHFHSVDVDFGAALQ